MKARMATLIEHPTAQHGGFHMTGRLGEAVLILERDGKTRDGRQRWRLMLATPDREGPITDAERNRRGAHWRMERRKAEGVESMGGRD